MYVFPTELYTKVIGMSTLRSHVYGLRDAAKIQVGPKGGAGGARDKSLSGCSSRFSVHWGLGQTPMPDDFLSSGDSYFLRSTKTQHILSQNKNKTDCIAVAALQAP